MHILSCMREGSFMMAGYYEFFFVKNDKSVSKYNFILLILYT